MGLKMILHLIVSPGVLDVKKTDFFYIFFTYKLCEDAQ